MQNDRLTETAIDDVRAAISDAREGAETDAAVALRLLEEGVALWECGKLDRRAYEAAVTYELRGIATPRPAGPYHT